MAAGTAQRFRRLAQPEESEGVPVDKNQLLTELLITARDAIEDALDELNPPPVEERLEAAMSEAPPPKGRSVLHREKKRRRG